MKHLFFLCALSAGLAHADATDDAFNAGSSFGKGNASQGTGSLSNPGAVTGAIPGYTTSPPESGYYGGVSGGDGGLANKGQAALQGNDAAQAIISSGNTNPLPNIDPNAPFITIGKGAESGAETIFNGTNDQCKEVTVSKSTFENFRCDKDVASVEACARTAVPSGHTETSVAIKTIVIDRPLWNWTYDGNKSVYFTFTSPYTGPVISASLAIHFNDRSMYYLLKWWGIDTKSVATPDDSWAIPAAAGSVLIEGQPSPQGVIENKNCNNGSQSRCRDYAQKTYNWLNSGEATMRLTLTIQAQESKWVPEVNWQESCAFDKSRGTPTTSVCTDPGGYRTVQKDGQSYQVYSDCWQYTDNYTVSSSSTGNCGELMSNPQCTVSGTACTEATDGQCTHMSYTWQCQKTFQSGGLVCGGDYFCKTGDCDDVNGAGDSGFDVAVAKLAGLASAADDVKNAQSQIDIKAFTGRAMSCRKAFAGFSNCCKDSGWGQDAGLSQCNSDEMAIGKAKAKKVTVAVGERCDHQVLGMCVQKSMVYCVFEGKLARIIQEQGRRDQLGVGFGSGDSPNCSGITVPQLQSINFDLINFSDFYSDLMNNQRIPNTDTMVKQVKDRIAAQVQQQQGAAK
ncbi:type-F conjugative transfer system mating-pair stabilization protein TraN [Cronobacter sakazakii]|uniref:type-F conjugative transfer system mating-pair stabilization protein TraN n=1 Tax=Cronobacter sakazakii TaxID=28141 RepID=UPI0015760326|nr:type-F conjugative transfer system mating-pair stabilization protein TraN [Cronobacter sakazakii]